jgi:hypothetical protein
MVDRKAQEISKSISDYLEGRLYDEPPQPFVLAGTIMRDLELKKSEFYMGIGRLIGFKVGEYVEGKKRYYYLLELVQLYRDKHKSR